jgi:hypothetical protein
VAATFRSPIRGRRKKSQSSFRRPILARISQTAGQRFDPHRPRRRVRLQRRRHPLRRPFPCPSHGPRLRQLGTFAARATPGVIAATDEAP